jgi:energy-coupling factor transporter transmembrane protein EcfT
MEFLIHFIFQLFKIAILASIYALILTAILLLIGKFKSTSFTKKIKLEKKKYWFYFGFIISIALFIFSFTYWGNHGLGDGPKIPIGHWETIENINWTEYGYLKNRKTSEGNNIDTTKFKVANDQLCGNLKSWFYDYQNSYFVLDLKTDEITEFKTEVAFNNYAKKKDLPKANELLSFEQNYRNHWSGIRFFLLP